MRRNDAIPRSSVTLLIGITSLAVAFGAEGGSSDKPHRVESTSLSVQVGAAVDLDLEGLDMVPQCRMTDGNLVRYAVGDCVPLRVVISNARPGAEFQPLLRFAVSFDHSRVINNAPGTCNVFPFSQCTSDADCGIGNTCTQRKVALDGFQNTNCIRSDCAGAKACTNTLTSDCTDGSFAPCASDADCVAPETCTSLVSSCGALCEDRTVGSPPTVISDLDELGGTTGDGVGDYYEALPPSIRFDQVCPPNGDPIPVGPDFVCVNNDQCPGNTCDDLFLHGDLSQPPPPPFDVSGDQPAVQSFCLNPLRCDSGFPGCTVSSSMDVKVFGPFEARSLNCTGCCDTSLPGVTPGNCDSVPDNQTSCDAPDPNNIFGLAPTQTCNAFEERASSTGFYIFEVHGVPAGAELILPFCALLDDQAIFYSDFLSVQLVRANDTVPIVAPCGGADVAVDKICPESIQAGAPTDLLIKVSNTGASAAEDVHILDTLPDGGILNSASCTDDATSAVVGSCAVVAGPPGSVDCSLGTLAVAQTVTCTLNVTFPTSACNGPLTNTATVTTTTEEIVGGELNNSDSCEFRVVGPDVTVDKMCPTELQAGVPADLTLKVTNAGTGPADDVHVTDTLPDGGSINSASCIDNATGDPVGGCIVVAGPPDSVDCSLGTLAPGQMVTCTLNVTFPNDASCNQPQSNLAQVSTSSVECGTLPNADSCDFRVTGPDVTVDKTCPVDVEAGVPTNLALIVSNGGTAPAADVHVTDTLPDGGVMNSASCTDNATGDPVGICAVAAGPPGSVDCSLGILAPGQTVTCLLNVTYPDGPACNQAQDNRAVVTTSSVECGNLPNEDICTFTVRGPDVTVDKMCPVDVLAGVPTNLTLKVTNAGTAPAADVHVTDTLPDGGVLNSASCVDNDTGAPVGICAVAAGPPGSVDCSLGTLAVGQMVTCTLNVTYPDGPACNQAQDNRAVVTTSSVECGNLPNEDVCTFTVRGPDVTVDKMCPVDVLAGVPTNLTLKVTNAGTAPAANVHVADTLPDGGVLNSASCVDNGTGDPVGSCAVAAGPPGSVDCNLGTLAPGQMVTCTLNVTYPDGPACNQAQDNRAVVRTDSVECGTLPNEDVCTFTVRGPDITVDKMCPVELQAGVPANLILKVTNGGTAPAPDVHVTDTLPDNGVINSASCIDNATGGLVGLCAVAPGPPGSVDCSLGTLAPGQMVTCTLNVTFPNDPSCNQLQTNVARVTTPTVECGSLPNEDSCQFTVRGPDVTVDKMCPVDIQAGVPTNLTLKVTNAGTAPAANVHVTDTLPDNGVINSASCVDSVTGGPVGACLIVPGPPGSVDCSLGTLAPGQMVTCTLNVTFPNDATCNQLQINVARVTTSNIECGNLPNEDSCQFTVRGPDVTVDKMCPGNVQAGVPTDLTLKVTNAGTGPAANVHVTDTLPDGGVLNSASCVDSVTGGPVGACLVVPGPPGSADCSLGTLAPGQMVICTLNVTYPDGPACNQAHDNLARVTTSSVECGDLRNEGTCQFIVRGPDITVDKMCPADVLAGVPADLTLKVTNSGGAPAANVHVTDTLPDGGLLNSASCVDNGSGAPVGICAVAPGPPGSVDCSLGTLAPGQMVTCTLNVIYPGGAACNQPQTNRAVVTTSSVECGDLPNEDSCQFTVKGPDVTVDKMCPVDVQAGVPANLTLKVTNGGTTPAPDVHVTDTLPDGGVLNSASCADNGTGAPVGSCAVVPGPPGSVDCSLGTLTPGQMVICTLNVTYPNGPACNQAQNNRAVVSTSSAECGDLPNDDSCQFTVRGPDLGVDKQCPQTVEAGVAVDLTLVVSNSGLAPAADVHLTDALPGGGTINGTPSCTKAGSSCSVIGGNSLDCSLGTLAPGEVVTCIVNATFPDGPNCGTSLLNTATVTTSSVECNVQPNSDTCALQVVGPDVTVREQCPPVAEMGETVTFTLTYQNVGTAAAGGVMVKDTLPIGYEFLSVSSNPPIPCSPPSGSPATGQMITCDAGALAIGAGGTITVTARVGSVACSLDPTINPNGVLISTANEECGAASNADECTSCTTCSDLFVDKTCPADPLTPGSEVTYSLKYGNNGTAPVYRVLLNDALPAGVTFVSASKPVCAQTPDGNIYFCPGNCSEAINCRGDVAPGFMEEILITVRVNATSGELLNSAFAKNLIQPGSCLHESVQDTCSNRVAGSDLEVIKTGPARAFQGNRAEFVLTVNNRGAGAAENVRLVDRFNPTLLDCSSLVASPSQGSCSADCATGTVTCDLGAIPGGGSATVSLSMVVLTATGIQGVIDNCAEAATTTPETNTTNNRSCIQVPVGSVDIVVDPVGCPAPPAIAGTEAIWTVQVRNLGNQPAQGVVVTNTLPQGVTFVDSVPAPSGLSGGGRTQTYQIGTLNPLSGVVLRMRGLLPPDGAGLSDTASATSASPESSLSNNASACSFQNEIYAYRMNFQPSGSAQAPGFDMDSGSSYTAAAGYGWSSSATSRERGAHPLQQLDTFVFSYDVKRWEMAVPNGDYEVTLAVGDPMFAQGTQKVLVEGVTAVNNETTAANQFLTRTVIAPVRDGMLTVAIGGGTGNTVLSFLAFRPAPVQPPLMRSINFQPAAAPTHPGFSVDAGAVYDAARGYGWSSPVDSRDRNAVANQLLDTFVFSSSPRVWEISLPNGTYEVTLSIGDAIFTQGPQQVKLEGTAIIMALTTAQGQFHTRKTDVTVSDGRLTLEIGGGGGNTVLNYVAIARRP